VYKYKEKHGFVDRIVDERTLIGKGLFKKDTNLDLFRNMVVTIADTQGTIESSFGQTGKLKVYCKNGITPGVIEAMQKKQEMDITLRYKKYTFTNKLKQ
jgi:selenocysteine-specific elongation factor